MLEPPSLEPKRVLGFVRSPVKLVLNAAHNNGMNAAPPVARFQVERQSRRPGYAPRSG